VQRHIATAPFAPVNIWNEAYQDNISGSTRELRREAITVVRKPHPLARFQSEVEI